jgi:predicted methyltransferase
MRATSNLAAFAAFSLLAAHAASQSSAVYTVPVGTAAHIRASIESAERSEEQRERDGNRMPAEILTLAGIEPGDSIIEFAAFGHFAAAHPNSSYHQVDYNEAEFPRDVNTAALNAKLYAALRPGRRVCHRRSQGGRRIGMARRRHYPSHAPGTRGGTDRAVFVFRKPLN